MPRRRSAPSECKPCLRAQRRARTEHECHGAVLAGDRGGAPTWAACGCDCQRTLDSLGFFDLTGTPASERVRQEH